MRSSRRDAVGVFLLLLMVLALAAGLRFYKISAQSLWADEGNSAALASRSLVQIARDASHDIHPPLYYWLLRLWSDLFGRSEAALRALSAVLGTLLVLLIAETGRRLHGKAVGLTAAFVAAISPFQVYYSQEARMYILLALEACLSVLAFWWLLQQDEGRLPPAGELATDRRGWVSLPGLALVAVWISGLYTHYAFPLMIGLETAIYLVWIAATGRRGLIGRRAARWAVLVAIALALYAPWLAVSIRQIAAWPAAVPQLNIGAAVGRVAAVFALGPSATGWARDWWVALPLALAGLGALPWVAWSRRGHGLAATSGWIAWLLPLAWAMAAPAMILGLALYREAYLKFLLIASPALALLQARGVLAPFVMPRPATDAAVGHDGRAAGPSARGILGWIWIVASLGFVGALSGMTLARYYNDPAAARDDYRGIAQFILSTGQPGDAVLLDAPGQSEVFAYYYGGDLPVYALPRQRPMDPEATDQELARLLEHNKVYAVYWASEEADPDGFIRGWLDSRGYKTLDQWRGDVQLVVYVMPERRPPDEQSDELNVTLDGSMTLLGYAGWNIMPTSGEVIQMQLRWRADDRLRRRYKVSVQLLDAADQVVAQHDAEPAGGSRPTDGWVPGEVILDNHGLLIPPGTPPGAYRRIVSVYDSETLERLRLADGGDAISLSPITVLRAKTPPPLDAFNIMYPRRFDFGAISLLGHDRYKRGFGHAPATPLRPGDRLHVTFYWQANATPRADWWFDLTLNDEAGEAVASLHAPLVGETYSTTLWNPGDVVRGEHDLALSDALSPGTYRLSLTVLPDTATPAGTAYLGAVRVEASGQGP